MDGRIRLANLNDAENATALLSALGLVMPADAKAHWQRMWVDNPAMQGGGPHPPLGWVLEDAGGRMQGFFANIPLAYRMGGRALTVGCASQWGVAKDWRAFVPQLAERYFNQAHSDLLLVTTAIKPTGRIFEKNGGLRVPQAGLDRSLFWIAEAGGFLKAALRKTGRNETLASLLSPALALTARLKRRLKNNRMAEPLDLEAEAAQFDALWEAKLQETGALMGLRTAQALRWHYPKERHARFVGVKRNRRLMGYGVLLPDHAPAIGLVRWRLADLLVLEDDPLVVAAILAECFRLTQEAKAHVMESSGMPEALQICLEASGAFSRALPTWPAYYKPCASGPDLDLGKMENWYLTAYDGDVSLL